MVQTVENLADVQIDYWAITTFWGFTDMIDSVGGLTMDVPFAMNDSYARADFQPGVQDLAGATPSPSRAPATTCRWGTSPARRTEAGCSWPRSPTSSGPIARIRARLIEWLGAGLRNIETTMSLGEIMPLAFTASRSP